MALPPTDSSNKTKRQIEYQEELTSGAAWDAVASIIAQRPWIGQYPELVQDMVKYAKDHQYVVDDGWFIRRIQELNINPFGTQGGGGGGASRQDRIRSYSATIVNQARTLGVQMTPEEVAYVAAVADSQSFSADQLEDAIIGFTNWATVEPGTMTNTIDQVRALASSYLVTVSDETAKSYASRIASGESTIEAVRSLMINTAKTQHPWLSSQIDQGFSPSEILSSSRDQIAGSLGISQTEVDFNNSRFMNMVTVADKDGSMRLANSTELTKNIRKDSAWAQTEEAKRLVNDTSQAVAKIFGRSIY